MRQSIERYILSNRKKDEIYYEHIQRYHFAKDFSIDREVLDIACGSGYGSYFLAKTGSRSVKGVDISKEAIHYCKRRYRCNNLAFSVMDATKLQFPACTFDTVISFETIEHIKDCNLFLAELKRVLKPNGVIVISTPNKEVYGRLGGDAHKFHVKEFYLDEFKELISRYFNIQGLYGQKKSEYYGRKVDAYNKFKKAAEEKFLLRINSAKLKSFIPYKIWCYLSKKIINLYSPRVSCLEDLTISENNIEMAKFFICAAKSQQSFNP